MSKIETLSRIQKLGIVPVVRASSADEAVEFCKGLIDEIGRASCRERV